MTDLTRCLCILVLFHLIFFHGDISLFLFCLFVCLGDFFVIDLVGILTSGMTVVSLLVGRIEIVKVIRLLKGLIIE